MLSTYSDLVVTSQDLHQYVEMRRLHINPALARQPGFVSSRLLRRRGVTAAGQTLLGLFNTWTDHESAAAWSTAAEHDAVSRYVIPLVKSIESAMYEHVPQASVDKCNSVPPEIARLSIQHVRNGAVDDYLDYRREVINPTLEAAPGFSAMDLLRDVKDDRRFLLCFYWRSAEDADDWFKQPYHLGTITDRMRELVSSELSHGSREFDVITVG